jgi:hypothetical protein
MMFGCGISDDPSFDTFLSDLVRTPITTAYKMAGELILCCAVLPCLALLSALFCLNLILQSLFSSLFSPSKQLSVFKRKYAFLSLSCISDG